MSTLNKFKSSIADEMKIFEKHFRSSVKSDVSLLNIITHYIIRSKGKQMRPMLVFLSAKLNGGITESTYHAATLIELLHTATLVHDDVVDEAYERRGFFSINALWKNKVSILIGDYLLSRGLLLAVKHNEYKLLEIVSEAVKQMAEGELLQIEKARKLNITEDIYFEIIKKKTATLIAACTASGAKSAGVNEEAITKMSEFGLNLGIAFQIKDDLFDYDKNNIIGKQSGNDIKEKKLTLPLIHVLNKSTKSEKKHIINLVRKNNNEAKKVDEVISFVKNNGGLEYAEEMMKEYKNKAYNILNTFPDCEAKIALAEMLDYTITRKK